MAMSLSTDTVTDPVCGMAVVPADAPATREHRGAKYWFCSDWCARRFDEDADAYLAADRIRKGGAADDS
jgi:Cu+-exporting ATPase